ncbi:MAG: hypothetical protein RLZZ524_851 [Pseudomonadota bacterium]|jgi:hypothetical protein
MANHTGVDGVIKISTNVVAEVRNWSINETADTIEDTTMNDTSRTYQTGLKGWSGSLTAFWDETDTNGQVAMTIGASIALELYPEGATTGDAKYSGTVLITSIGVSVPTNGMVERTIGFQGTGALTIGTTA